MEYEQFVGPYKVAGILGKGGMGSVYLGQKGDQQVAIKVLTSDTLSEDQDLLERLKREGETLRLLNHPNIVKMLEVIEEGGRYSLVLEYVEGGTLHDLLQKRQQLPVPVVLKIALELSDALTRAHHLKVIHRDIKPSNILFARDGTVRLTDFGLARMEHGKALTQSGILVGSVSYLSPEAINGGPPDPRRDIWAFGVVLYEMLAGERPFDSQTMGGIITRIVMNAVPDITQLRPDIPPRLAALTMQMLDKDVEKRISSVRQVAADLETIIREENLQDQLILPEDIFAILSEPPEVKPVETLPTIKPGPAAETVVARRRRQRIGWAVTAITIVLLALVAVAGLSGLFQDDDDTGDNEIAGPVTVEPVAEDEVMILVARAEPLGEERPQIDRFIRDELTEILTLSAGQTGLQVREYPQVITAETEAKAAANLNNAPLIVWGNYDDEIVELNISLYDANPDGPLTEAMLQSAGNVRVRLTDERQQTIAPQVLTSATIWYAYQGQPYEAAAAMVAFYDLNVESAETVGVTVGANVYRHYHDLYDDTEAAVGYLTEALRSDPDNPILFHLRGAAVDRLGETEQALEDVDTAQLLSNEAWSIPFINKANITSSQGDLATGIEQLTQAIANQPDDWLYYAVRGSYHYLAGDFAAARADLEASIEREPRANFPYVLLMNIAIQEGQIDEVQSLLATILDKFPDPSLGNRTILTAGNQPEFGGYYSLTLSAFNNLVLRQYESALQDINGALELRPESPELYLFQGVVYCAQEDLENAEAAYTTGLELNDDMTVLYLLRADVRNRLGKSGEALRDFSAASQTSSWDNFKDLVSDALSGGDSLGCQDFFEVTE
ncbi:MAG: protein kinase [Chloroflexi bacterium]|nr:protein kinase [Chloroflexota bacterium]